MLLVSPLQERTCCHWRAAKRRHCTNTSSPHPAVCGGCARRSGRSFARVRARRAGGGCTSRRAVAGEATTRRSVISNGWGISEGGVGAARGGGGPPGGGWWACRAAGVCGRRRGGGEIGGEGRPVVSERPGGALSTRSRLHWVRTGREQPRGSSAGDESPPPDRTTDRRRLPGTTPVGRAGS